MKFVIHYDRLVINNTFFVKTANFIKILENMFYRYVFKTQPKQTFLQTVSVINLNSRKIRYDMPRSC